MQALSSCSPNHISSCVDDIRHDRQACKESNGECNFYKISPDSAWIVVVRYQRSVSSGRVRQTRHAIKSSIIS
jgi:hypothetical protein